MHGDPIPNYQIKICQYLCNGPFGPNSRQYFRLHDMSKQAHEALQMQDIVISGYYSWLY